MLSAVYTWQISSGTSRVLGVEECIVRSFGFLIMVLDCLTLLKVRLRMQMISESWEVCSPVDDLLFLSVAVVLFGY